MYVAKWLLLDLIDEDISNFLDLGVVASRANLAGAPEALIALFVSGTFLLATVDCFNQMCDLKRRRSNDSHCVLTKVLGGCLPEVCFIINPDLGAAE